MEVTNLPSRSRGFTLVELLVTLAITILLTGLAIPSLRETLHDNTIGSGRSQLTTLLNLARSTAIRRGLSVTLCPSDDGSACSDDWRGWHRGMLLFEDPNRNRQRDVGEAVIRRQESQPQLIIHSSPGRRSIRYSPDGAAWGSNLTLRICSRAGRGRNRALVLYGTGRVRPAERLPSGGPVTCD